MERIDPILPSTPALAPIDATQVKVHRVSSDERSADERKREQEERRDVWELLREADGEQREAEEGHSDHPHVDVRA